MPSDWRESAREFFSERARQIQGQPGLDELSYVSGRDARLWRNPALLADMRNDILGHLGVGATDKLLEVGCAAGFLAKLLAPKVDDYVGIDVSRSAIRLARKIGLQNASFKVGDGAKLPFPEAQFDAAVSYDVFTNFPSFEFGVPIIVDMLRVVKPGGRVLIGSLADKEMESRVTELASEISEKLKVSHGDAPDFSTGNRDRTGAARRWWISLAGGRSNPMIHTFAFERADFLELGARLDVTVVITEIHRRNPYYGCRFNAIYTKRTS